MIEWDRYVDEKGNFEFPKFLYQTINDLMKSTLDLGTLVCVDDAKKRAYKEKVKKEHRQKWREIATVLERFGLVQPCVCRDGDYCEICGGSRFVLDETLNADEMRHVAMYVAADAKEDVMNKLYSGMLKAVAELDRINLNYVQEKANSA